jgi:translation initiation factor 1 (eIF-1/SUI1)
MASSTTHPLPVYTPTGLQQRNGRKTLTTVQGLPDKYDPKKLLKAMKKEFACNGTVVSSVDSDDEDAPAPAAQGGKVAQDFGKILQLQGDQRTKVKDFLVGSGLVSTKEAKDTIVMLVRVLRVMDMKLMIRLAMVTKLSPRCSPSSCLNAQSLS